MGDKVVTFLLDLHIRTQRCSPCGLHFTEEETEVPREPAQGAAAGKWRSLELTWNPQSMLFAPGLVASYHHIMWDGGETT